jgi:hypothetical protein
MKDFSSCWANQVPVGTGGRPVSYFLTHEHPPVAFHTKMIWKAPVVFGAIVAGPVILSDCFR